MAAWLIVLAGMGVAVAPGLLPASFVRRQVAKALAERLGRPVSVEWANFSWRKGLLATGIRIEEGDPARPGALFAKADTAAVRFHPLDLPAALTGADVPIEWVRLEGLECWIALDEVGRGAPGASLGSQSLRASSVQITDGTLHVQNRALGRTFDLSHVNITLGELTTTGRGYINLTADLPGDPSGDIVVTATLNNLDFTKPDQLTGSLKAEWNEMAWAEALGVVAAALNAPDAAGPGPSDGRPKAGGNRTASPEALGALVSDAAVAKAVGRTSGRLSATFGRGKWTIEGAVEAFDLNVARPGTEGKGPTDPSSLSFDRAVLGFQLSRPDPDPRRPLDLSLIQFTARGVNLQLSGTLRPDTPKGPEADLRVTGAFDWAPLAGSFPPLRQVAEHFESLGGGAQITLDIETAGDAFQITGLADLAGTKALWPEVVCKEAGRLMRVEVEAAVARDFSALELKRLEISGEAGRLRAGGWLPLPGAGPAFPGLEQPLAGALPRGTTPAKGKGVPTPSPRPGQAPAVGIRPSGGPASGAGLLNLKAAVWDMKDARAVYPILNRVLGPVETTGPVEATATLEERPAESEGPSGWTAKVHVDLTQTALVVAGAVRKKPGVVAVADLGGTVLPEKRAACLERLDAQFDQTTLTWSGLAALQWPAEAGEGPTGQFQGDMDIHKVESAAAVLAAGRWAPESPPLAGDVRISVQASLEPGLRGALTADLAKAAVRIGDYFVKPAGQVASASLEGTWRMGEVHDLDGVLRVTLPVGKVLVKGAGRVDPRDMPAPAEAKESAKGPGKVAEKAPEKGAEAAPPAAGAPRVAGPRLLEDPAAGLRRLISRLSRDDGLQVRVEVTDLARLGEFSPALAARLKEYRAEGAAACTLVLSLRPETLASGLPAMRVGGSLDLTEASFGIGQALVKPRDMPLKLAVAANYLPPHIEGMVHIQLDSVEARLDESTALLEGWVELALPASVEAIQTAGQAAALLSEAQLKLTSRWQHRPQLQKALPWLDPLYGRCKIEGATALAAEFSGTPTRGHVGIGLEATSCQFVEPGAVDKPAGTPATLQLEARYGEVPGELIVDRLDLKLADAGINATGRLLFDDPRLSTLAPPTTWTLRVEGRAPNVASLASLFPLKVAERKPAGGVTFLVQVAVDPFGVGLEQFELACDQARMVWLDKPIILSGKVSYDGERLATDGLGLTVGRSDVTLVGYISHPDEAPTGSLFIRGKTLALEEVEELVRGTHEQVVGWASASGVEMPGKDSALSREVARRVQRFLGRAQVSGDVELAKVTLTLPEWQTTYELENFSSDCRLSGNRFVVPRFHCGLNEGEVTGEAVLDFRPKVPALSLAYDAKKLKMRENLKPFVDTTFPGLQVFGTMSTRATGALDLAPGAYFVAQGETVLTDGLLEGPAAPDYMTAVFPGLALTQYPFSRMSNVFENLASGNVENRMLFEGKMYNIFIFGASHPEKGYTRTDYTLGIDLSVSLGSKVWSRDLDQGKIPLMEYTGRIVGPKYAEQNVRYVLPHELAWDVFVKRNLVTQLIRSLGQKPPDLKRPPVGPEEKKPAGPKP